MYQCKNPEKIRHMNSYIKIPSTWFVFSSEDSKDKIMLRDFANDCEKKLNIGTCSGFDNDSELIIMEGKK